MCGSWRPLHSLVHVFPGITVMQTETLLKLCKANYRQKKCQAGSFNRSAANFWGISLGGKRNPVGASMPVGFPARVQVDVHPRSRNRSGTHTPPPFTRTHGFC